PDIAYSDDPPTFPDNPEAARPSEPVIPNADQLDTMVHKPFYPTAQAPHIYLEMPVTAHVDIELFNILGQSVGTIKNAIMSEGPNEINIRESMRGHLAAGKYIYRIRVQDRKMSKSVMMS
ncbi:MAG: T9SS type A sorting domain-containing protein, partial [Pricia sp.]